jgi:ATP-binding cassette subfamily E protein 1
MFLSGEIPPENMKIRNSEINFNMSEITETTQTKTAIYNYPEMTKILGDDKNKFELCVEAGTYADGQITVLLGENGTGKTTFIRMLAGLMEPDIGEKMEKKRVSYKPQHIVTSFDGTVEEILSEKIGNIVVNPIFKTDVMIPMKIDDIMQNKIKTLSGGELQRVAIVICLGTSADIYLFDEPSASLDCEQRMICAKVIKRFIKHTEKIAFVVEHDFMMATYLADKVIVYEGLPSVKCVAHAPQSLLIGMNLFLKNLGITFRKDKTFSRPRINKLNSQKDAEQKKEGKYFFIE